VDFRTIELFARAARWLERTLALETVPINRPATARRWFFQMEAFSERLQYRLSIDGGYLFFQAAGLDQACDESSKPLLTIGATSEGFRTTCRLIAALERSGVKAIRLPMEIGTPGMADSWLLAS
jgi:hypothetical protein